jgi:hypothetical protein
MARKQVAWFRTSASISVSLAKMDSPFRQSIDFDAATSNFTVDDARRSNRIRRYVKSNFATAFSTLAGGRRATEIVAPRVAASILGSDRLPDESQCR